MDSSEQKKVCVSFIPNAWPMWLVVLSSLLEGYDEPENLPSSFTIFVPKALSKGEPLLVTRLERLARSIRDLLNTLDAIGQAGARFRSLNDTWADTTTAHGRLLLTFLGGIVEFEQYLIRARTGEGRVRVKARGVHMGRPQADPPSA